MCAMRQLGGRLVALSFEQVARPFAGRSWRSCSSSRRGRPRSARHCLGKRKNAFYARPSSVSTCRSRGCQPWPRRLTEKKVTVRRRRRRRYLRSYRTMRAPDTHAYIVNTWSRASQSKDVSHTRPVCLDLCAARQIHTRTTLPHEPGRNIGNITSPALQSRRVTSSCGCVKRRGLKPRPSLDSSLHPQCGWRVGACRSLG